MSTLYSTTFGRLLPRRGSFFATLLRWMRVHREREALRDLDDWLLADIGISRTEAKQEFMKRFWQE